MRRRSAFLLLAALGVACEDKPDAAALSAWRKEAQEANARLVAEAKAQDAGPPWILHVEGEVEKPVELGLEDIRNAGPIHVTNMVRSKLDEAHVLHGVTMETLIARAGPRGEASSVTAIANDGYWTAIDLDDMRKYEFIVAFDMDGTPLSPAQGGPIKVAFELPRVAADRVARYHNANVLYLTHLMVGDESPHVRIGSRTFDQGALDALPETKMVVQTVSWRTAWEATPQVLWGVHLRDLVRASGRSAFGTVRVRAKDALHQKDETVPKFSAEDLERCEIILARNYGDAKKRIPTSLGGPVLLAVGGTCRERFGRGAWMAFVEDVELTP